MSFIQNKLGLEKLIHARNELFHRGQQHDVPQDVERYIQLVFFELAREILSLPCVQALENFIQSGFNVNRLDPANSRRIVQTIVA